LLHHHKGGPFSGFSIGYREAYLIIHLNGSTFVVSSTELNDERTVSNVTTSSGDVNEVVSEKTERKSVDQKIR
jgi:hypothetical protein